MTVHELKVVPPYFDGLADGSKTFEVRRDDRQFAVGDVLRLREWSYAAVLLPTRAQQLGVSPWDYTGREVSCRVTSVFAGDGRFESGLKPGFVVLGLSVPGEHQQEEKP